MEKISGTVVWMGPTIGEVLSAEEAKKLREDESRKIFKHFWENHWKEYKTIYWKELDF